MIRQKINFGETRYPYMKLVFNIIGLLLFVLGFAGCKTTPATRSYNPYFDQTKTSYVKTPSSKGVKLDTTVIIRSNLRDVVAYFYDTIYIQEHFIFESGNLAVPLELINEKPPTFDSFLVARQCYFTADYINLLFPVISDTLLEAFTANQDSIWVDSLKNATDTIALSGNLVDSLQFSDDSLKEINSSDSLNLLAQNSSLMNKPEMHTKSFFTIPEILADSTRDLLDADSILNALVNEAPVKIGDTILYTEGMPDRFLDSILFFQFDTIYIEVFDSSKIIPQLPFNVLSETVIVDTVINDVLPIPDLVTFRIFHPDEKDIFIEMVRVAGGTFKIGNNEFDEDERPAYKLKVSSFLLSKYEVTNRLFCFFLNDMNCDSLGEIDGIKVIDLEHPMTQIKRSRFSGEFSPKNGFDDFPVINVSWIGAQMFCKLADSRLPSEAEWEYAARGGVYAKRFYTDLKKEDYDYVYTYAGGNYMVELGWFVDNSYGAIHVGGRMKPNELGLYDMCGNVWEWCYDKYNKEFYRRNGDSSDPMCLTGPNIRVNRGGCWSSDAMYCRVTNRNYLNQYSYNPYLGFRYMRKW